MVASNDRNFISSQNLTFNIGLAKSSLLLESVISCSILDRSLAKILKSNCESAKWSEKNVIELRGF